MMGRPIQNRWRVSIISPVNREELWSYSAPTLKEISLEWRKHTGNDFLSDSKLTRATLGKSKNEFIKIYRLGSFDFKQF